MTVEKDRFAELYELSGAQCDGALSSQQLARLEELVLGDPGQRRQYVLYMHTHAQIEEAAQEWEADPAPRAGLEIQEADPAPRAGLPAGDPSLARPFGVSHNQLEVKGPEGDVPEPPPHPLAVGIPCPAASHAIFGLSFAYAVAALVMAVGVAAAWVCDSRMRAAGPAPLAVAGETRGCSPARTCGRTGRADTPHWPETRATAVRPRFSSARSPDWTTAGGPI